MGWADLLKCVLGLLRGLDIHDRERVHFFIRDRSVVALIPSVPGSFPPRASPKTGLFRGAGLLLNETFLRRHFHPLHQISSIFRIPRLSVFAMDSSAPEPEKPLIPPPDLPKPSIPPPTIPPLSAPDSSNPPLSGPPVVNVRIRKPGDRDEPDAAESSHVAFHTRVVAVVIDCLLAAGFSLAAVWILPGFAEGLAWLVGAAYLVMRDSLAFLGGQSIGKKAMDIRLITLEDQSLVGDWKSAWIRNGVLFIPFFALIEIFILLTREERSDRGKRLGDEWAKTKIIPDRSKIDEGSEISS